MFSKKSDSGSRKSRRVFLQSTGALAAALSAARPKPARAAKEALALNGGPKAVTVPYGDASRWPRYGDAEEKAILELVRSPDYGPIEALENDWRNHFGVDHAKAHANGTSALTSMFFALDLPPGSEIMVPSHTFFATIVPMRLFGYVPIFVDVNPRTMNFDLEDAKKRLTRNTRAVLPVHWLGLPCDMEEICDWAEQKGLFVLEDAAHAHGAKLKGKYMGSWGRMSMFSFQRSKPLPAVEGGMGVYQNKDDHDRATAFGHYGECHGKYAKYHGTGLGVKFRIHPFAAALARTQLAGLAERNEAAAKRVRSLNDRILPLPGLYEQTSGRSDMARIYYLSNMLFIDETEAGMSRKVAVGALQAEGVSAHAHFYPPQHKMTLYSDAQWWHHPPVIPTLPGTDQANATGIALPYFTRECPELIDQYVQAFEKVWAHRHELGKS